MRVQRVKQKFWVRMTSRGHGNYLNPALLPLVHFDVIELAAFRIFTLRVDGHGLAVLRNDESPGNDNFL